MRVPQIDIVAGRRCGQEPELFVVENLELSHLGSRRLKVIGPIGKVACLGIDFWS